MIYLTLIFETSFAYASNNSAIHQLRESSRAFASVAKQVSPAVVNIQVEQESPSHRGRPHWPFGEFESESMDPLTQDFFRFFFGAPFQREHPSKKRMIVGQGSGFIVDERGYIITNYHVIKDAAKILVKLQDNREFEADVIGVDVQSDIAIVKIAAGKLPVLSFGNSDLLEVGEWVVALGNPFGLSHTMTAGIVSAKGRNNVGISDYEDFIQTDAAINPGNSGGPLVNLSGDVIGINTAIFTQSGGYMGIGFAIPSNMAQTIIQQLIQSGKVTRGYLGIKIQDLTPELIKSFNYKGSNGILIAEVIADSPASQGGLLQGDIIIKLNGQQVESVAMFRKTIALSEIGSRQELEVLRKNQHKKISIQIAKLPAMQTLQSRSASAVLEKVGLRVQELNPEKSKALGVSGPGVLITEVIPGSSAATSGLIANSLIIEANRQKITDIASLNAVLDQSTGGLLLLLVYIRGEYWYVTLRY